MNKNNLSPIVLFTYNRPAHTKKTLEALSKNELATDSTLFIFCDGPKTNATAEEIIRIDETRLITKSQKWCKEVNIIESDINKGLATSIIDGVTKIVNEYGKIIVLEDDIVTGIHFLEYMNTALTKYQNEKEIWHITGFRDPIKTKDTQSAFLYPVMDCWSWATWADRWQYFKKDTPYYQQVFTEEMKFKFNMDGTEQGMWEQIEGNARGTINTWAIFWYASIFLQNGLCLSPTKSLARNIGFDNTGVHCGINPMEEIKDSIDHCVINFPKEIKISNKEYIQNKKYMKKMRKGSFSFIYFLKTLIPVSIKKKIKTVIGRN